MKKQIGQDDIADQTLHETEAILASIFASVMDAVITVNEDHKILLFNHAAEIMFRCSATDLTGQSIDRFIPARFRTLHREQVRAFGRTNQTRRHMGDLGVIKGLRADGEEFPAEASISHTAVNAHKYYTVILRDITEKEQAEAQLKDSEQRFRLLAENATDIITRIAPDGSILYVSPSCKTLLGYDPEALLGRSTFDLVHPEDLEALATLAEGLVSNPDAASSSTYRIRHKDGHYLWIETFGRAIRSPETGKIVEIQSSSRDISNRMRSNAALRESESRFRLLIESTIAGAYIIQDGKFTYANPALSAILGYTTEELVDHMGPLDVVHPEDQAIVAAAIQSRLSGEVDAMSYGFRIIRKDGTVVDTEVLGSRTDYQGRPALMGTMLDVTDRKRAEEERLEAEKLRIALAKEHELRDLKTRFIAMVSHEYKSPLAVILSSAQMLLRYKDMISSEQQEQRLEAIASQVTHLSGLLEETLVLSRGESVGLNFNPTLTDIGALCQEVVTEIQEATVETHEIEFSSQGDYTEGLVDSVMLRRMLKNLLSNAVKYSPAGGAVYLDLTCNSEQVLIRIKDAGIGIPKEDQDRIFETFHRAQNVGPIPGTGLGLAIVKQAVDAHQGSISFESDTTQGTTFTVMLPVNHTAAV